MIHSWATFKTEEVKRRYAFLSAVLQEILYEMGEWCEEEHVPFLLTDTVSTPEEDHDLNRKSATHRTARAADASVKGWNENQIKRFMLHFQSRFLHVAAIGGSGNASLIVRHNSGRGDHMHIQIAALYAINDPLKLNEVG